MSVKGEDPFSPLLEISKIAIKIAILCIVTDQAADSAFVFIFKNIIFYVF